MSLRIVFPNEIEELAVALDGVSEATARAAASGPESLAAFRFGMKAALMAVFKAEGQQKPTPPQLPSPCPIKGIYASQSNGYFCRFYRQSCPLLTNPAYNYVTCPGWHNYQAQRKPGM